MAIPGIEIPRVGPYVDQSAANLGLAVASGAVDPRRFAIWSHAELRHDDLHVDLFVIGASHLVTVTLGAHTVSEVLSCATPTLTLSRHTIDRDALDEGLDVEVGGLRYQFEFRTELVQNALPSRLLPEGEAVSRAVFPARDGHAPSETVVAARPCPGGVEIQSLHWYESEGVAALSRTVLTDSTEEIHGS